MGAALKNLDFENREPCSHALLCLHWCSCLSHFLAQVLQVRFLCSYVKQYCVFTSHPCACFLYTWRSTWFVYNPWILAGIFFYSWEVFIAAILWFFKDTPATFSGRYLHPEVFPQLTGFRLVDCFYLKLFHFLFFFSFGVWTFLLIFLLGDTSFPSHASLWWAWSRLLQFCPGCRFVSFPLSLTSLLLCPLSAFPARPVGQCWTPPLIALQVHLGCLQNCPLSLVFLHSPVVLNPWTSFSDAGKTNCSGTKSADGFSVEHIGKFNLVPEQNHGMN